MQYKSSALSLNVRPCKVLQAAKWLVTNSSLYREHGISFHKDRASTYNIAFPQNETDSGNLFQTTQEMNNVCDVRNPTEETEQLNDWTEDDTEIPAGVTDPL